jgi:cytochrome c-type biogenesis protein
VIDAPLALAFTAGLVAVLNPCGFAMLPAYLSFFVVGDTDEGDGGARGDVRRALVVGLSVSGGFASLFAVVGFAVRAITDRVLDYSPWVTVVIGIGLVILGALLAAGRELRLRIPRLDRGGQSGHPASMFVYGVSYAVVSLGCTLPTFLAYVAGTITRESFTSGAAVYFAYAGGFASLLTAITVAIAGARRSLVVGLRRVLPLVSRLSGALLVLAGSYVAYYGWYELHRLGESDPAVDRVTGLSFDLQQLIDRIGVQRLGAILGFGLAAAAIWSFRRPERG